jgi:small subunit ribosomal protein S21
MGDKKNDDAKIPEELGEAAKDYNAMRPPSREAKQSPLEVEVNHGVEKALKILKRKLIKEGLFKDLKSRRFYEKPSDRRKRKTKESLKKIRKEESRRQKSQLIF